MTQYLPDFWQMMTPHLVFLCCSAPVQMKKIRDHQKPDLRGEREKIT
ncbi:TPA: hypothetical protein ACF65L_004490 [Salmonella enterica]|nr:hypothetical protein [Salmonella enterica subsp. enterica serovar Miami]EEJ1579070.1 hypothetical protein [Salmonella enterica subsp. enterica serovar Miami]EEJ2838816.1 hypothetical protein [Salmonella enterica subsp. enterica serovar Miami]